ncbi:hypothetical protein Micbo1qcDRAFT_210029 [Microdochium bolleyi]|uniref:BZIP domain-containing protein n=1 Tax=Microdochium bolleyi TaxID=196109 RepID=A0A136IKH2_9PEZI|nr:hypothetical protein Micbo1qcDRAFT_210029 [Microdochium bolleyi]
MGSYLPSHRLSRLWRIPKSRFLAELLTIVNYERAAAQTRQQNDAPTVFFIHLLPADGADGATWHDGSGTAATDDCAPDAAIPDSAEERRQRKRLTDRVAQRQHRKRQKLYIEELEAQLRLVKDAGAQSQLGRLAEQNFRLREEMKQMHAIWDDLEALLERQRRLRQSSVLNEASLQEPAAPADGMSPVPGPSESIHCGAADIPSDDAGSVSERPRQAPVSTSPSPEPRASEAADHLDFQVLVPQENTQTTAAEASSSLFATGPASPHRTTGRSFYTEEHWSAYPGSNGHPAAVVTSIDPWLAANLQQLPDALQGALTESHNASLNHDYYPLSWSHADPQDIVTRLNIRPNIENHSGSPESGSTAPRARPKARRGRSNHSRGNRSVRSSPPHEGSLLQSGAVLEDVESLLPGAPSGFSPPSMDHLFELLGSFVRQYSPAPFGISPLHLHFQDQSEQLPLVLMPPQSGDENIHDIVERARAHPGAIVPPSIMSFLFDTPGNTLSTDLKALLAPIRQSRSTSEFLATYWVLYLLVRWLVLRSEEAYQSLPVWLRPTSMQLTVLHPVGVDLIAWPEIREKLIHVYISDAADIHRITTDIGTHMTVELSGSESDLLRDPGMIEGAIANLANWKLSPEFFDRYPQLRPR